VEFKDVNSNSNKNTSKITILILTPLKSLVISPENLKELRVNQINTVGTLRGIAEARVKTPKALFPLIDKDTTVTFQG